MGPIADSHSCSDKPLRNTRFRHAESYTTSAIQTKVTSLSTSTAIMAIRWPGSVSGVGLAFERIAHISAWALPDRLLYITVPSGSAPGDLLVGRTKPNRVVGPGRSPSPKAIR